MWVWKKEEKTQETTRKTQEKKRKKQEKKGKKQEKTRKKEKKKKIVKENKEKGKKSNFKEKKVFPSHPIWGKLNIVSRGNNFWIDVGVWDKKSGRTRE